MAKRITAIVRKQAATKAALKASTALVPATDTVPTTVAVDGDNDIVIQVNRRDVPTMQLIRAVAQTGFDHKDDADKANGQGTQCMAYVVMALHSLWRNDGHPDYPDENIPDLASVIHTYGKDNRSKLKSWLVDAILGEALDIKNMAADARSAYSLERTSRMGMLSRGMNMASILVQAGVSHIAFNQDEQVFYIDPMLLIPVGHSPIGRIAKLLKPIPLDRTPYACTSPTDAHTRLYASIDQLNKAQRTHLKIKPSRAATKKEALNELPPRRISDGVSAAVLIEALKLTLARMDKDKKLTPDAFAPERWNDLSDILWFNDKVQNSEAFKLFKAVGTTSAATVVDKDGNAVSEADANDTKRAA